MKGIEMVFSESIIFIIVLVIVIAFLIIVFNGLIEVQSFASFIGNDIAIITYARLVASTPPVGISNEKVRNCVNVSFIESISNSIDKNDKFFKLYPIKKMAVHIIFKDYVNDKSWEFYSVNPKNLEFKFNYVMPVSFFYESGKINYGAMIIEYTYLSS